MTRLWLQNAMVGLGAGVCAALLLSTAKPGSSLAFLLNSLGWLPILITAIGWNHWAGLFAGVVVALGIAPAFGPSDAFGALLVVGLPAWWLGYLTLLARPTAGAAELEWYPPDRLLLWCAVLGALAFAISLIALTGGHEISMQLRRDVQRALRIYWEIPRGQSLVIPGIDNPERLVDILVAVTKPFFAGVSAVIAMFNLWLAARVLRMFGRLKRPWPDLTAIRLPAATPFALAAALAASFAPGIPGLVATLLAGSVLYAYAAVGFAVMHDITRDLNGRAVMLIGMYATVIVLNWPIVFMGLLGLIDTALDLRARVAAARGPPSPLA
jgi:Predicted membrane protein (DUF2232)